MEKTKNHKMIAAVITVVLCLIFGMSLIAILLPASRSTNCIADIYQDGELLTSIPLDGTDAPWRFTVTGTNGCVNEIEVRSGSIGIISADCPDKLCVHQGFISNTSLPIVCLPNKLVIRLRDANADSVDTVAH